MGLNDIVGRNTAVNTIQGSNPAQNKTQYEHTNDSDMNNMQKVGKIWLAQYFSPLTTLIKEASTIFFGIEIDLSNEMWGNAAECSKLQVLTHN